MCATLASERERITHETKKDEMGREKRWKGVPAHESVFKIKLVLSAWEGDRKTEGGRHGERKKGTGGKRGTEWGREPSGASRCFT